MPVAPATFRSLAIWVSFWMLISFSSAMFSPSPDRFWPPLPPAGFAWLARAAAVGVGVGVSACGASGGAVWPLDARGDCGWRLWLFGMA